MKYTTHAKGYYGIEDLELKFSKKGKWRTQKRSKVQMAQNCNWHGNEEQKDNAVYYLLQSCGVQA